MNEDSGPVRPESPIALRIATWNLNHWRQPTLPEDTRASAWRYLTDVIGADVALVQEAVPPSDAARDRQVYGEIAGHRNWGSAIVGLTPGVSVTPLRSVRAPFSRRRYLLTNTHPGSVAVGEISVADVEPITVVSIYGVMDGSSVSTMHRVIADLVPLFDSPLGARVILGGDFNVSMATRDPRYRDRAAAVLDGIRSLGLVDVKSLHAIAGAADCACGAGPACGHVATWGNVELDYLFVTPSLAGQVTSLRADRAAVEAGLSDHVALVVDLALSRERTPHWWDEEALAIEIGRRHGAAARGVVEKLVSWAERRERELEDEVGVAIKALTRFPTNGVTTEPELWFPIDYNLYPRAVQPSISIRARGDIVIQFGTMRHPPFDTPEGREQLLAVLNEIPGVNIARRHLAGWPSVPLSVLEEPANLGRLVEVMDRLATESFSSSPRPTSAPELAGTTGGG